MRNFKMLFLLLITGILVTTTINWAISDSSNTERENRSKVNTRIDNNGYWKLMAEKGLAVLNPDVEVPAAVFTSSKITSRMVRYDNSPDVPVTGDPTTQSENSIFIDPNDNMVVINSNNSTPAGGGSVYGVDYLYSFDFGETWGGDIHGPNGTNSGDPAACIGTDGRWYIGYIGSSSGQDISYSDDQGASWTKVQVAPKPGTGWGDMADKNHMWIDTKVGSPYENHLYNAWTDFGGGTDNQVVLKRSIDNGETWESKVVLSYGVAAGSHNQGVNISTGPNGEVYAVWTIYDSWPSDEKALGFAKSLDGGATWETSYRIIDNIKGIRSSDVPQNMRVNSFPSMAVDVSNGTNSGNIYVVWTNVGIPGVNTGSDRDVYMIKSTDGGDTFGEPIRVNQDLIGEGKAHYLPWISCDASTGVLSTIFYDNRNTTPTQAEAWVAVSNTAGEIWEDFKVSDVAFTPTPIPGLASGYFGDYLAIHSLNGKVYPCWTDNRTGSAMTYVSVFETLDLIAPTGLTTATNQETGQCLLDWNYTSSTGFQYFNVYRDNIIIGTSTEQTYTDQLLDYGYFTYEVTAVYSGNAESTGTTSVTQYGSPTIEIIPDNFVALLYPDETDIQIMTIKNNGVLYLDFSLSPFFKNTNQHFYQTASGGGDEYIHKVIVNDLHNSSGSDYYTDYTNSYAKITTNQSYPVEVHCNNHYSGDQCKVWVDWDQNGIFDEDAITLVNVDEFGVFKGNIDAPKGSKQGTTRMRVRLSGTGTLDAYGDTEYGEVEDYALQIADWLTIDPDEGIIPPGDSLTVTVTFDATGMTNGTYSDDVIFISNDLENPVYPIDFTMNITDMQLTASANPNEICNGESTQLLAVPTGGSGTYTYSWASIPEGFTSLEQEPLVHPTENTEYFVSVYDGIVTLNASTTVVVFSLPIVELGEDQILCGETQYPLDAGNPDDTYLWSTDEISQTIDATGSGETMFWAEVTNGEGCSSRDTVYLNFATIPEINLGADTAVCGDISITLDAGNQGSTYLWSTGETSRTIIADTLAYGYGIHDFSVEVTSEYGCINDDGITIDFVNCTGIDELSFVNMNIYPNPSSGIFNLELKGESNQPVDIKVMNVSGTVIYSLDNIIVSGLKSQKIDISRFADGVYTLSISSNGASKTQRIVLRK